MNPFPELVPLPSTALPSSFPFPPNRTEEASLLLLSFNPNPHPSDTPVRNPMHFTAGREVWVWKPWRTADMPASDNLSRVEGVLMCDRFAIM